MTADFSTGTLDAYLVGQYAYWAGDFDFAQQCYANAVGRDVSEPARHVQAQRDDSLIENISTPDDLLRFVADRREQRISERRAAFGVLVDGLPGDATDLESQPLILESSRLRGAVWRVGAREFEMRAYVSGVKHGKHVLKRAKELAHELGFQGRPQPATVESTEEPVYATEVYEWEESGNPFLTIVVSRLLFIEVGAFWTGMKPPTSFAPVQERLQRVLESLSQ